MASNCRSLNLEHLTRRVYSQGEQAGVIESIFNAIGVTNRHSVETGFDYRASNQIQPKGESLFSFAEGGLNTQLLYNAGNLRKYFFISTHKSIKSY